jgi:hypothetical protein
MFNGTPQSAAALFPLLRTRGVARYRFEALFESASQLRPKVTAYLDMLSGVISPQELLNRFSTLDRYGVSEGQLFNLRSYKDRKKSADGVRV